MKKIALILSIISISITLNAQEKATDSEDVIINHKMIAKFNNAQLSENYVDFTGLMTSYSFSDIKLIVNEYRAGKLKLETSSIDRHLVSLKQEEKTTGEPLIKNIEGQIYASKEE